MLQLLVLICALFLPQSQLFLPPTSHRDSPRPGEVLPPKDGWQSLETFFDCHNCEGKGYWRPGAEGGRACCSASAAAAKSLQSCPTLCDPIDGSLPGSPRPWDSPGKNTGVGCHFLLQCMKVKSESEVTQSCPTLSDPPPWTAAHQAAPSMGFSRQEYWSGVPLPSLALHLEVHKTPHRAKEELAQLVSNAKIETLLIIYHYSKLPSSLVPSINHP